MTLTTPITKHEDLSMFDADRVMVALIDNNLNDYLAYPVKQSTTYQKS